jgi:tetratricopeptide (TPR) repeat protein
VKPLVLMSLILGVFQLTSTAQAQVLPITTNSEAARAHFERGRHSAFHYDNVRAREHLDAAIAADPAFVLAYLHRGGMSSPLERGPYFEAARAHRDAVSAGEQRMVDAFHAFLWEGDVQRAVEIFTELAEQYPDDPYLPTYLGLRYYHNLQRYDEARAQFHRALERDSTFAQAHKWLGYVALDQEDYEAAEAHFRRYVELAPTQGRPHETLGRYYLRTGRPEEAAAQFQRSVEVDPRFTPGRESLMRLYIQQANRHLQEAFARRDARAIAGSYAHSATFTSPSGRVLDDVSSIEEFWQDVMEQGVSAVRLESEELYVGDAAYINTTTELGRYQFLKDEEVAAAGTFIVIWAHTADGWKRFRHMWASYP